MVQAKGLWELLQPYHDALEAWELYLTAYKQPVEYLVPPASIIFILSVSDDPSSNNSEIFQEILLQAAANLVALNRQRDC